MIETSNPEIDVNKLMEQVQAEAARSSSNGQAPAPAQAIARTRTRRSALPALPKPAAPLSVVFSRPIDPKKLRTEEKLENARGMITVSSAIPKLFRGLFRRQGGFNRAILDTVASLTKNNLQLNKRVQELTAVAEQQSQWLRTLAGHRQTEAAWMQAAQGLVSQQQAQLDSQQAQIDAQQGRLPAQLEQHGAHLRNLQVEVDRQKDHSTGARAELDRNAEKLRDLQEQMDRSGTHLRNLQGEIALRAQHLHESQQMLIRLEERQVNDAIYIKGQLAQHGALLQQWHDAARALPGADAASPPNPTIAALNEQRLDTFYLSFENRFRGERAQIKEKVRPYLSILGEAAAGASGRPILDVGCGRGEWLELLKENGLEASGLDLNTAMIAQCRERGLSATHGDVIEYLRTLQDATLGAVTGFHIIEHLPLEVLIDLVAETQRVLLPGGIALFESPNCKNLMVGACNFNVDPTHRNPVFPETAAFIFETYGFEQVRLEYLSPVDTANMPGSNEIPQPLHHLLYGPQDFAVIGRKPGPR